MKFPHFLTPLELGLFNSERWSNGYLIFMTFLSACCRKTSRILFTIVLLQYLFVAPCVVLLSKNIKLRTISVLIQLIFIKFSEVYLFGNTKTLHITGIQYHKVSMAKASLLISISLSTSSGAIEKVL